MLDASYKTSYRLTLRKWSIFNQKLKFPSIRHQKLGKPFQKKQKEDQEMKFCSKLESQGALTKRSTS